MRSILPTSTDPLGGGGADLDLDPRPLPRAWRCLRVNVRVFSCERGVHVAWVDVCGMILCSVLGLKRECPLFAACRALASSIPQLLPDSHRHDRLSSLQWMKLSMFALA
jgi:hypothetical protein